MKTETKFKGDLMYICRYKRRGLISLIDVVVKNRYTNAIVDRFETDFSFISTLDDE